MWWRVALAAAVALGLMWVMLSMTLWILRPGARDIKQALRLMPDVLRLVTRLARDRELPAATRLWLWGLLIYLALPIDLIPDFIPVIGYADDAIITVFVLRNVVRTAGVAVIRQHWPGTPDGYEAVCALTGLKAPSP